MATEAAVEGPRAQPPVEPRKGLGLKAASRAAPLSELGRCLLGVHIAKNTPKEK